jgi:hypothetical protein
MSGLAVEWDGGAGSLFFGDGANWNPDVAWDSGAGSTNDPYVEAQSFAVNSNATVTLNGLSFNVSDLDLNHASGRVVITSNTTLKATGVANSFAVWNRGTVDVYGKLEMASAQIAVDTLNTDCSVTLNVLSGGQALLTHNNSFHATYGDRRNTTINVDGSLTLKLLQSAGWTNATGNSFGIYVNHGGVFNVSHSLTMFSDNNSTSKIYLDGGVMNWSTATFGTNGLSSGNGMVFRDYDSFMTLSGNQTNTVQAWINAGFVSSTKSGTLMNQLDGGNTKVYVKPPPYGTVIFIK